MADIQEIYARLLARGYQAQLFSSLETDHTEKGGRETLARCPYCQDKSHFSYSAEKPVYKCWKCQKSGDWLQYMEDIKGLSFMDALQELATAAGVDLEVSEKQKERHQSYVHKAVILDMAQSLFIKALEGSKEMEYLLARGYTAEQVQDMELGSYSDRQKLQEALRAAGYTDKDIQSTGLLTQGFGDTQTVSMLWRDKAGRATGLACRAILEETKPKYKYSYGLEKSKGLIGLERSRGSQEIILVEGLLDALLMSSHGLHAVATGGTSISTEQIKALEENGTKEVLLAFDMDKAGQSATYEAIRSLRKSSKIKPYVVSWSGYKDPDEMIRTAGLKAFQTAFSKAERWPGWAARHIISLYDISLDRGMDRALDCALDIYAILQDPIEKRDFYSSMQEATGLEDEELSSRLQSHAEKVSERKKGQILERIQKDIQEKAAEGDILGAELALEQSLKALQVSRGVVSPDPYLLEEFQQDILQTALGLRTGYQKLDEIVSIPQGAITIVAGRPRHGKTTLQLNLLSSFLDRYPKKSFYFFSYEEARKYLALKLLLIWSGVTLHQEFNQEAFIGYMKEKRGSNEKIERAISKYEDLTQSGRLIISDQMLAAPDLASTIGHVCQRVDVGAIMVDYIQRIPAGVSQSARYLEIKNTSALLLEQAVSQDVAIILGAQLSRGAGSGQEPKLEDLRESGDIEQDANLIVSIYNGTVEALEEGKAQKQEKQDVKISVLKQRGGLSGRKVTLSMLAPVLQITDQAQSVY